VRIEPVSPGNDRATVEFLTGWVTDGPADRWEYLAGHTGGEGASLVTVRAGRVIGIVSALWESNYAGFRDRGIPRCPAGGKPAEKPPGNRRGARAPCPALVTVLAPRDRGWQAREQAGRLMLGHSHALSGAVTGVGAGIFLHLPLTQTGALAGFTAGMALLPDLDKCGSSPARCLGFLSEAVAWVIGKLSGGHRHATHSFLGIALFTGLAWVSCHYRGDWAGKAGLALLMTLSVSAGLEALRIVRGHLADLIGIAVASWEVWFGYGLRLIPLAVFLGCSTHIIGDMLTDSGCMLTFPLSRQRYHLLPEPLAFTTGTGPELLIVDPVLTAALLVLALWAADPAFVAAHWHELAG
jgi:membrane-bound metal-dependent hydrolase YbcI (DUF457 family)